MHGETIKLYLHVFLTSVTQLKLHV